MFDILFIRSIWFFFPPRIPLVSTCMFEGCDGSKNMHINVGVYDAISVYIIKQKNMMHWKYLCDFLALIIRSTMASTQFGNAGQCSRSGTWINPRCWKSINFRSWSKRSSCLYRESSCNTSVISLMSSCVIVPDGSILLKW